MKKCLLVLLTLFILSGCTVTRIDKYDYKQAIDETVSLDMDIYNTIGNGYKYYAPKGITRILSKNYNDVLKRNNNLYYLYVDVVSYFYKTKVEYEVPDNIYYSKEFDSENKYGFINIQEKNDKLYVQMVYNYAKIETYVDKKDLKQTVMDISYILSTVNFNDSLLNDLYKKGELESGEQIYKLFSEKEKEGNFLEYAEQYDKYEEDANSEQELIIDRTTTTKNETTTQSSATTTKADNVSAN